VVEIGGNGNGGSRRRDCMARCSNGVPSAFYLRVQLPRLHGPDRTCIPLDNPVNYWELKVLS